MDELLRQAVQRVLVDVGTIGPPENDLGDGWQPDLWKIFVEMGLPWVSLPEDAGGSGGTLGDAYGAIRMVAMHGHSIPLPETGVLAGWLLTEAGLPLSEGPATVTPMDPRNALKFSNGRLEGTAYGVPFGRAADRIVMVLPDVPTNDWLIISVPAGKAEVERSTNLAGEPRDTLYFRAVDADAVAAPEGVDPAALELRGALTRAAAISGALTRTLELTTAYARDRQQFGKPIRHFQAVQAHLVSLAQHTALVSIAVDCAIEAAASGGAFEIAAAKAVASEAAGLAAGHAHQVHGAIGLTREYPLQTFTRRLWSWRDEFGSERSWSRRLGAALTRGGPDSLYPSITSGSVVCRSVSDEFEALPLTGGTSSQ